MRECTAISETTGAMSSDVITGHDGKPRCAWAGAGDAAFSRYHDEVWGTRTHDESAMFEALTLGVFEVGLSWSIVFGKRDAFRTAFRGFDVTTVAAMTEQDVDRLVQGGFNWSSQRLDCEGLRCESKSGAGWTLQAGCRCGRLAGRLWRGGRSGSGSGWRSPRECRVRTPALRLVCPQRSVRGGSATAAGSGRSAWPRYRADICRFASARRSLSWMRGASVSARSRASWVGRHRRFPGSCGAMPRPAAAAWSTGPARPSGTPAGGPGARRPPGWP